MITIDSHIHTDLSSDCSIPMEVMAGAAVSRHLTDICITDHMDYEFPSQELPFVFDMSEYMKKIKPLQVKHEPNLNIRTGVELGLKPSIEPQIKSLLNNYRFDFVIGSIHLINNTDPFQPASWEPFASEKDALFVFFEQTLSCLESFHMYFDSLAHLDYAVRYTPSGKTDYSISDYRDIIDAILMKCIEKEKALEVNTSAYYRMTNNTPHPNEAVLKRYHELGGELLTIGSDAHRPEHIGSYFKQCNELLFVLLPSIGKESLSFMPYKGL